MNTKHTPGPWFVLASRKHGEERGYFDIGDSPDVQSATVLCTRFGWPERADEMLANANLIAAAPEMFSEIEREYTELADIHNEWAGRHTPEGQMKLIRLRNLIAKATGRSEQNVQDDYSMRAAIAMGASHVSQQ